MVFRMSARTTFSLVQLTAEQLDGIGIVEEIGRVLALHEALHLCRDDLFQFHTPDGARKVTRVRIRMNEHRCLERQDDPVKARHVHRYAEFDVARNGRRSP